MTYLPPIRGRGLNCEFPGKHSPLANVVGNRMSGSAPVKLVYMSPLPYASYSQRPHHFVEYLQQAYQRTRALD